MNDKSVKNMNEIKSGKNTIPAYEISPETKELFQVNLDLLEKIIFSIWLKV